MDILFQDSEKCLVTNKMETERCHNCDRYFPLELSPDGGATCSEKCSREYLEYLNEGLKRRRTKMIIGEWIEQATDEELIQNFLNLTDDEKLIKRDKDIIKSEFQKRMAAKGIKKLALENGHISLNHVTTTNLNTKKVREFLAERLEEFTKTSESDRVTIMSWDSKEAQMKLLKEKNAK